LVGNESGQLFEVCVFLDGMHMRMHDVSRACCYPTEAATAACMRSGDDGKAWLTVLLVKHVAAQLLSGERAKARSESPRLL